MPVIIITKEPVIEHRLVDDHKKRFLVFCETFAEAIKYYLSECPDSIIYSASENENFDDGEAVYIAEHLPSGSLYRLYAMWYDENTVI